MRDSIGSECCKDDCEGTEFECACFLCEQELSQDPPLRKV